MSETAEPRRALICGVSGQDGAYLAQLLLAKGYQVWGTSRDAQMNAFSGLQALGIRDRIKTLPMSPVDFRNVLQVISDIRPHEIYNLAGQSSVGLSFDQPLETMESIAFGTLNLLEAIRFVDTSIRFYNAGSSECFGDTGGSPADESTPFRPRSPYAVAKAAATWHVAVYRESYGLFACTGMLFNHESPLPAE
jgi:GDPmannose 4,6-dehydratase